MLADTLRSLSGLHLKGEDGAEHVLELLPPATDVELRTLESSLPAPLPDEIRDALRVSKGLAKGPLDSFSLVDLEGFGLEEAFPQAYSIAHDGFGNYWVLDLLPGVEGWGPVLFACHDPPVIAYQSATVEQFLLDAIAIWRAGPRSPVDLVREDVVHRIWRDRPEAGAPAAAASSDPGLAAFAASLPHAAVIGDLRRAALGDGFAWGRFGPRTDIRRAGHERLWALVPPEPKPGFLRRLFGS
jgi:hypothetical protein